MNIYTIMSMHVLASEYVRHVMCDNVILCRASVSVSDDVYGAMVLWKLIIAICDSITLLIELHPSCIYLRHTNRTYTDRIYLFDI